MKERTRCSKCGKKHNPRNIGKCKKQYSFLLDYFSLIYLRMLPKEPIKHRFHKNNLNRER
jgi:hypothetical protein